MSAVECRSCGGEGHHGLDEDGHFFTCYACGGTGSMTVEAAAEWDEENAPLCGPVQPVYRGEFSDWMIDPVAAEAEYQEFESRHTCGPDPRIAAFWADCASAALFEEGVPF